MLHEINVNHVTKSYKNAPLGCLEIEIKHIFPIEHVMPENIPFKMFVSKRKLLNQNYSETSG